MKNSLKKKGNILSGISNNAISFNRSSRNKKNNQNSTRYFNGIFMIAMPYKIFCSPSSNILTLSKTYNLSWRIPSL